MSESTGEGVTSLHFFCSGKSSILQQVTEGYRERITFVVGAKLSDSKLELENFLDAFFVSVSVSGDGRFDEVRGVLVNFLMMRLGQYRQHGSPRLGQFYESGWTLHEDEGFEGYFIGLVFFKENFGLIVDVFDAIEEDIFFLELKNS